jgi:hypothetical protein
MRSTDATGPCPTQERGTIVITVKSATTASVTWTGTQAETDDDASFDASSCKVSHPSPGAKKSSANVVYSLAIDPTGALSGSVALQVNDMLLGCRANYSMTGSKN